MADDPRPNPDALLDVANREEAARRRGRLKVFLGMCPGVGKTFAMLEAAQRERKSGRDVVVGLVETHGRPETAALLLGLPQIRRQESDYRGVRLSDFDLQAALLRRPQLVLVDELAHTNVPGFSHPKRWQDIQELLDAGIDVFTTLNVQHVESRADTVRQITGTDVRETIPDAVLDDAVLELVDLPPAELLQRLRDGKVYLPERAQTAATHFFREGNLTALRELALRLVADHVGEDTREFRHAHAVTTPWKTSHRLLVAVGPSPTSESLIRWTRRMSDGLHCPWLAVHVEGLVELAEPAQAQLQKNLGTARELGGTVVATADHDLVAGLLRVAREQNVTQIIVGKPAGTHPVERWRAGRMLRRLTRESGDIDLHVVRADKEAKATNLHLGWRPLSRSPVHQYLAATTAVVATGGLNLGLHQIAGPRVPGLVFLLVVVVLALWVGRGPVLLAGALSALVWNFFFLSPRFTFAIGHVEDAFLFGSYFLVAVVLGQLVTRIREHGEAERRREARATALYELTRDLAEARSRDEVVWHLVRQVGRVFQASASVAVVRGDTLVAHPDGTLALSDKELAVSDWAFRNAQAAGRFTHNLPGAAALHLPLTTERKTFGTLVIDLPDRRLALAQRDWLETFARQAALVLDRIELRAAEERARWLAESERLGRTLLNSISHELRTPLAASSSAVHALANLDPEHPELRAALLDEIRQANDRLNRIVGNLLDVSRLESGQIRPRLDWHDARDLVETTLQDFQRDLATHPLSLSLGPPPCLARLDFSLIQQALANLVLNAVTHTPAGTSIEVSAERRPDELVLSVSDRGHGLPQDLLSRVFDKFARGPAAPPGGSGLGLTIARGFVEAHGGTLSVENRPGGGARFTIRLPQPIPPPHCDEPG